MYGLSSSKIISTIGLRNIFNCCLFLSTSIQEGFGFTPLEAIINNAPVAALKSDISEEIMGNIGVQTISKDIYSQ